MPIDINPKNTVTNWEVDTSNNIGTPADLAVNSEDTFVINDVVLEIPPTAISIQNEDLVWHWKTLRTKSSTKISSGRGMCQVTLNVVFTPDLLLHLHRLVVQFNHSPFCWVRNRFIRESIAPHWPTFKQMAFTMTGFHVANLAGHPGSFNVQIDLRWFNYAPYGANYLFRRDWRTKPIHDSEDNTYEKTIDRWITKESGTGTDDRVGEPEQIQFKVPTTPESLAQWSPVTQNPDIHAGFTLQQLKENHLGEVFDLLPLPKRMKRSYAVGNPAQSNIYVRYINNLQQKSLGDNFNIDVYQDLTAPDADPKWGVGHPNHVWEKVTVGERKGEGLVRGLHTGTVPQKIRSRWMGKMLTYAKTTTLTWNEYLSLDLGREINQQIFDYYRKITSDRRNEANTQAKSKSNRPVFSTPTDPSLVAFPLDTTNATLGSGFMASRTVTLHEGTPDELTKTSAHNGVDIGTRNQRESGRDVMAKAILPGILGAQGAPNPPSKYGGGGYVVLYHGGDTIATCMVKTLYLHMEEWNKIPTGSQVNAGDIIGKTGGWPGKDIHHGGSTGPHLHFEVQIRNTEGGWTAVDPVPWISKLRQLHLPDTIVPIEVEPEVPEEPEEETESPTVEEIEDGLRTELAVINPDGQMLTDDQLKEYSAVLLEMMKNGYVIYEGDSTIKNVYMRVQSLIFSSQNYDKNWDPLRNSPTGKFLQHDAVVTSVAGSLGHIVASIPIIGHEYPTHQHLGSIEPTYGIEFTVVDPSLDGLSESGQILQGIRNELQENARKVRSVPGCSTLSVDNFITRLLGTYRETDRIYNGETTGVDHLPRAIISRSSTQTVEGAPGTSIIYWDIQETNPYEQEFIVPSNEFGEMNSNSNDVHRDILKALERVGTSNALDSYGSKNLLLGLGEEVVGIDALRDIDPQAANYFESSGDTNAGGRTFLVLRASESVSSWSMTNQKFSPDTLEQFNMAAEQEVVLNSQMVGENLADPNYPRPSNMPYDVSEDRNAIRTAEDTYDRYETWAEQNGILIKKVGVGSIGSAALNLQDVTDLSMQLFETGSYQGYENAVGYGTSLYGGAFEGGVEEQQKYQSQLEALREYEDEQYLNSLDGIGPERAREFSVVETTNFTNLSPSQETELKVQNYAKMLSYIKITADLILCEEGVNDGEFVEIQSPMAFSRSEIRKALYDLDINPSMYGAWYYSVINNYLKQFFSINSWLYGDQIEDMNNNYYRIYPWLKIDDNPDLKRWIDSRVSYGVVDFLDDLALDMIGDFAGSVWRRTGAASAWNNVFGDGKYDYNEAFHYDVWTRVRSDINDAHQMYATWVFPLQGGVWTQNLVEEYFAGFSSKLGVQYATVTGIIGSSEGEERFGLSTFLGGLSRWWGSSPFGMKYRNQDSANWNPITTDSQAEIYREYQMAALARSAGVDLPNLDKMVSGGDPMYLWEQDVEMPYNNIFMPFFTTLLHEKVKVNHLKGLFKGLAELIRGEPDVMEVLGIMYTPTGMSDMQSEASGTECYPDLDLPDHPYYGNALYAMNPDFYYWNIYDDATGTMQKDILEKAEEAVMRAVSGPYNALKSMQKEGMDVSEYSSAYGYIDVGDDTLVPETTKIIAHPEGSDEVDMSWYPEDNAGRVWLNAGKTHAPITATSVFIEGTKKLNPEYVKYLKYGEQGLDALQEEINKIPLTTRKQKAQAAFDELKHYNETQQVFPPLLSNWHGNQLYAPTGDTLEKYQELNKKVVGIETFFGSRLGFVGGLPNSSGDERDGLTDTRLASLAEYQMAFDEESLKRLAVDSAKDILSQKYTMRRAFPTFKLYFVEEDQIYNRVLSFDDFHAFNGVKEFTVHQSRKSPADTATIVLQNVSGTLDGTKRGAITDLDYFKTDESGNFINPVAEDNLDSNSEVNSNATTEPALPEEFDDSTSTAPSWLDSRSQPFGSVVLRPGLNVQLRVGYSNDPSMLNVLISGRITDVQWSTNGDLVEIVVQSFGTELVKYLKGRGSYRSNPNGEEEREIYPTTHQLLSSLMLSSELKHFGRWTNSGIFQHGESKDASVDFTDYEGKSFFSNFRVTSNVLNWMMSHPGLTAAGYGIGAALMFTPVGKGVGTLGRTLFGSGLRRIVGVPLAGIAAGSRFVGTKFLSRKMARVLGPGGQLGTTKTLFSNVSNATTVGANAVTATARINSTGAFNGIIGGMFRSKYTAALKAVAEAVKKGNTAGATAAVQRAVQIETAALYTHGTLLQMGIGQMKAVPFNLTLASGAGRLARGGLGAALSIPINVAKLGMVTMVGLGAAELTVRTIGGGLYDSTIGAYRRQYALTKARLFLSPQDDNLYPPAPKDYMHFDYTNFWEKPGEWIKNVGQKLVFGAGQNLLYAAGVTSKLGVWAEDNTLQDWYNIWSRGEQPPHVLEKRVIPAQCHYYCDNVTIWDVFHEMTLRHPGWVYGARPYGTRFRYTMFFGVPSQRYWAKPATNTFIHRINKIRDYLGVGITEESYNLLYGPDAAQKLRDDLATKAITYISDNPNTYFMIPDKVYDNLKEDQRYETYEEAEAAANGLNIIQYTDGGQDLGLAGLAGIGSYDNRYGRITEEITLGDPRIVTERFESEMKAVMTTRVLEEYLLGLENRFVPFRRYHYITSDADIVNNGIISSNKNVVNAVSVLYQTPDSKPENSRPGGVVEMKASARIPEEDIQMAPVQYTNCRGYTMGLRYGLGSLLYSMKEMYRGELLILGNPRIRPWDICILRDEYNDMIGPVEVEAVVHMFSHETGYLTEIKPNAVVIANEISSYPILNALQLMCMAVEDNNNAKSNIDTGLTEEENEAYRHGAWSQDMQRRYRSVFGEDGFSLDELFPNYDRNDMEQIISGVGGDTLNTLNEYKDQATNVVTGVTGGAGAAAILGGAWLGLKGNTFFRSKAGAIGTLAIGGAAIGGSILANKAVKSTSLQWFLAAPILFAQAMEEEAVSIVPLTKNGLPIVSGLSLRDPAMMWRSMFGRLYNFAQDTAIGLQDMSWYWSMSGDNWWETWVRFTSDGGFNAVREDMASSAGG